MVELLVREAALFQSPAPALSELECLNRLPPERVRLCFDVTDRNVDDLFMDSPAEILEQCVALERLLRPHQVFSVAAGGWLVGTLPFGLKYGRIHLDVVLSNGSLSGTDTMLLEWE